MRKKIDPVVDEAIETLNMKDGPSRRRLIEGAGLFSATAAASALIAACSSSSSSSAAPTSASSAAAAAAGNFPDHAQVEVHVREPRHGQRVLHPDPVRHGRRRRAARPAHAGLDGPCPPSRRSTMLSAFNAAVTAGSPGIATTVVSATAFVAPINSALQAGIPVVTYNANGVVTTACTTPPTAWPTSARSSTSRPGGGDAARLADEEGRHRGRLHRPARLAEHPAAHGRRHAGPGGRPGHEGHVRQQGRRRGRLGDAGSPEQPQFLQAHGSKIQGVFAVDGGDRPARHLAGQKYSLVGKVPAGGFDLEPQTLTAINGRPDQLHHRPVAVPAGLPAHAVPLPLPALRRPGVAADHGHRPEVRRQGQRGSVHRDAKTRYEGSTSQQHIHSPRSGPIAEPAGEDQPVSGTGASR